MHLFIGKLDGYIEERSQNKYLLFDLQIEKNAELWDGIKNEIETINGAKAGEYGKEFIKIKFNWDDNLPLNKSLKLHMLTIVVRSIFEEDGKFYPQIYLDEFLHELQKWCSLIKLKILKELILIKLINQKSVKFVITAISTMVLNLIQKFVMIVIRE